MFDSNGCQLGCDCYKPCSRVSVSSQEECVASFDECGPRVRRLHKKVCIAHGDPHYHTFDGPVHDYQGTGTYIMCQRKMASCLTLQDFLVVGFHQSLSNPAVSYLMWMELHVFLPSGTTKVKVGQALQVWVNGNPFSGTNMPAGISSIDLSTGKVDTTFGVTIHFDGHHEGNITITSPYHNCVEGICGDADGNPNDEWINKQKRNCRRLPANRREWCFGNSWHYGRVTGPVQTKDKVKLTCNRANSRKFRGMKYCGALGNTRGPFRPCLMQKRAAGRKFYSSCMYDACAYQKNIKKVKKLTCAILEAFVNMCGSKLVRPSWRNYTGCRCPGELVWTNCGRKCTRTCRKPRISCGFKCVKRCQCPRSAPYQQGTSCLTQAKCKSLNLWP
ncbi:hypothetical protein NP493_1212g00042 [Ridgeia piscesae]|uniref:VWFD domain-containing protein n=1 Tax=Ridgeia piscesae TaxID=27915 RepID=A0AAD9KCT6_RIDPI|nr:hypothetical protein NP493_1212g00042 [Ridgeia piscesae]